MNSKFISIYLFILVNIFRFLVILLPDEEVAGTTRRAGPVHIFSSRTDVDIIIMHSANLYDLLSGNDDLRTIEHGTTQQRNIASAVSISSLEARRGVK